MENRDICIIAAKEKSDWIYDAMVEYGFHVMIPYKDKNLLLRLMREVWFQLRLPGRQIWFNRELKGVEQKVIIVKDSLICPELLEYIRKKKPDARLVVMYLNRVRTTFPAAVAAQYADELWSYDADDCKEFGMRQMGDYYFSTYRTQPASKPEYDVVYLGRDKGRAGELLELEAKFKALGLSTYFHISPDRSFLRFKKSFYKPAIPYREYVKLLSNTRALLNIMPEEQRSITPRDMEVIFDSVKGITNNKGIKEFRFY